MAARTTAQDIGQVAIGDGDPLRSGPHVAQLRVIKELGDALLPEG